MIFKNYVLLALVSAVSSVEGNWDELESSLGSKDSFQITEIDDWADQCLIPFADVESEPVPFVSNYQLFLQPSGLCSAHLSCAYEECSSVYPAGINQWGFNSSLHPTEVWKSYDGFNLPSAVVHPVNVADISATIKFAIKNKIEISIKTSGHSYTGSSTKKGTILLNLSKLQKYSPFGSIVECSSGAVPEGAYQEACDLAAARNKDAILRVGGGEIFDEAMRAVSFDWNNNNEKKYHLVTGGSGTVSAAGGWLASGGLSGNNGMRMYGLGVDQVLHVEMVLPSGTHVRFGPSQWKTKDGNIYPITTEVTGYCNMGELSDEILWDWQECSEDINFSDLWYAVRGGGGGTFGVITSVYYQLHEFIPMEYVTVDTTKMGATVDQTSAVAFVFKWSEFFLKFFFLPESIGVAPEDSNLCSSPSDGGPKGGSFFCFGGAEKMKEAWTTFYGNEFNTTTSMSVDEYFTIDRTYKTYAEILVLRGSVNPNVPAGRAIDDPFPAINPPFGVFPNGVVEFMMYPLEGIVSNVDKLAYMLAECAHFTYLCTGNSYIQGGNIPHADDGLNSLATNRRHGGFLMIVYDPDLRHKFQQVFYGVSDTGEPVTGDNFKGGMCHNHASVGFPTPLKSDWTKACDLSWSDERKAEECLSFQETAFGTETLNNLERIHTEIDPNRLFRVWDGVGYADLDIVVDEPEPETDVETESETKSNTVSNNNETSTADCVDSVDNCENDTSGGNKIKIKILCSTFVGIAAVLLYL